MADLEIMCLEQYTDGCSCTELADHEGDHVAGSDGFVYHRWPRSTSAEVLALADTCWCGAGASPHPAGTGYYCKRDQPPEPPRSRPLNRPVV